MDLGIKGRVALVTASTKGIGYKTAELLALEGAYVCICSRDPQHLEEARERIYQSTSQRPAAYAADMAKAEDIQKLVDSVLGDFGRIDILVVNAGGPPAGDFFDFSDEDWYRAFETNFMSGVRLTRLVAPLMLKQNWGRIVYITSTSVKQPIENLVLSNAVRAAAANLAKSQALAWADRNVLVNTVGPGLTATDRIMSLNRAEAEKKGVSLDALLKEKASAIPIGRLARSEEVASLIVFLCSEQASYMTGSHITVDGGLVKGNH